MEIAQTINGDTIDEGVLKVFGSKIFINPTHVAPDPVLAKRVKLEVPDFGKDYDGRVKKGEWLNSLFSLNDEDAKKWASPFQDSQEVFDWGWTPQAFFPENGDPDSIPVEYENKLDEAFKDPKFPVDKLNNVLFYFLHDTEFKYKDGRTGKPTEASYANVANARDGAFIFDSNYSPTYRQETNKKGDVPDLDTLSDLAYFQWQEGCKAIGVGFRDLKVIFRASVSHATTFATVMEAMRKGNHPRVPAWKDRVTFKMDSPEGLAILGSGNGASTAWFLIQHREELGAKRITEVVVWGPYEDA
ncbi:hypothetical protein QIS74_03485 [Colletotrichum tabaci]|uniref:Uncharacterized protein n=1 Tax=Colletotrichum tabaci TaxID=1209068 RepID=A0AAV9TKP4_9PEZI